MGPPPDDGARVWLPVRAQDLSDDRLSQVASDRVGLRQAADDREALGEGEHRARGESHGRDPAAAGDDGLGAVEPVTQLPQDDRESSAVGRCG